MKDRYCDNFKCSICGKFIGYKDVNGDTVVRDFQYETSYTQEKFTITHKKCIKK